MLLALCVQKSLAAAKKSLAADDEASQPGREMSPNNHNFDSEDMSVECQTPESTPHKQPRSSAAVLPRNSDSTRNAVSHMVKEFEQQRKVFEDDASLLVEAKSGQSLANNMNPQEELQKLKDRFATWKKHCKVKLQETKAELQKHGNFGTVKTCKWWIIRHTKRPRHTEAKIS